MATKARKRTWETERAAIVRWLRWQAKQSDGFNYEANLIRRLARGIDNGKHHKEGA